MSVLLAGLGAWQQGTDHGVYLTPGFGGFGVGAVGGVQVAGANGLVFSGEVSVTTIQKTQYGGLVTLSASGAATRATMYQLALLVGQRVYVGRNSVQFLGGIGFTGLSLDGVYTYSGSDKSKPISLVLGFDASQRLSESVDLVETARFAAVSRSPGDSTGLGSCTLRFGAGIRIH